MPVGERALGQPFSLDGRRTWRPLLVIIAMHLLALPALFYFSWLGLTLFLALHFLTGCLGLVIGFHRLLSHHAFRCNKWVMRFCALCGTLSLQEGPIRWASHHRAHHRFNDEVGDPHASSRGFLWSHLLWLTHYHPNGFRKSSVSVRDLLSDRYLVFLDRNMFGVNLAFFLVVALIVQDPIALVWAFPLRIVVIWHTVWSVNSYAHRAALGKRDSSDDHRVRDSWILSFLIYGDGWHASHHSAPGDSKVGAHAYQIDPSYLILQLLEVCGLVSLRRKFPNYGPSN